MRLSLIFALTALAGIVGCDAKPAIDDQTSAQLGFKQPTPRSRSKIDVKCGKTTYTLDTGTNGGSCTAGVGAGSCGDGDNKAAVNCDYGCTYASGSGTCTKN